MATIDEVFKLCTQIKEDIATINQRCSDRGKTVDGHQKTLYGSDGRGGVVAAVNNLNGDCKNKKAANEQAKEFFLGVAQKLIVWSIISLVIFLLYLWKCN